VNCQKGIFNGAEGYFWVFFVTLERGLFEAELLSARHRAEASARVLEKSERFIKTITDAMPSLLAYWDADLRCRFANKPYLEWFGILPEAIIGTSMLDLLGERVFALNEPFVRGVLAGERQQFERSLRKADGSVGYSWANYIPDRDTSGSVVGFFALVSDVTPLKAAEAELKLAASVFQNTTECIMVTDGNGTILSVNPAFSEVTGYTSQEIVGQNPRLFKSEHHDPAFHAALWQSLVANGRWEGETWNRKKEGGLFLVWQTITKIQDPVGEPLRYVSVFHDITDRWHKDERTRFLAFHDALTGLPNRSLLMERIDQLVHMTEREPRNVAVMFLDLDRFKVVNDTFGHPVGDDVLIEVARKLQAEVRQVDLVARLGGDEFVVVLDNPVSHDEVARIAGRIVATINEPMDIRGHVAQVGTSIGIAMHPRDGASAAQLVGSADLAMYAAKAAGKNCYRFFNPRMHA
jgi:diguanylate cyclase (GGDEF)-like protein/PAS domain S-box-containing protein